MLGEVLSSLHNWFLLEAHTGTFVVNAGKLELPFLLEGQYFRIIGSALNDGVYRYPAELRDEAFTGSIWALAVPGEVLALAEEIAAWQKKNGQPGPYMSESFGGYSHARYAYSMAENPESGLAAAWQDIFRSRLNRWRKL